jgi:predicted ATP-dependent protease
LFADRLLYFLLAALDPELTEHFKVLADFEDDIWRTAESEAVLARLLASLAKRNELKPLDRGAVALVLERARLADHSGKLSLIVEQLHEILIEADFCAGEAGDLISDADVERTLASRIACRLKRNIQLLKAAPCSNSRLSPRIIVEPARGDELSTRPGASE